VGSLVSSIMATAQRAWTGFKLPVPPMDELASIYIFLRNAPGSFWTQYPIGTTLSWTYVEHRLEQNRVAIFHSATLFLSLFALPSKQWDELIADSTRVRNVLSRHIPCGSRVSRYAYLAVVYLIVGLLTGLLLILSLLVFITIYAHYALFAVLLIVIWLLVAPCSFFLWFALYRYPVFDIVYPRAKKKILSNNSYVYTSLIGTIDTIRVVRLKAGSRGDVIKCDLCCGRLSDLEFEALSYVWGVGLMPHTIHVAGKPFYVTSNLYSALKELRHPEHERTIWIDAICINQQDNVEKSSQVQMMRDIYAKASKVVVWLGNAAKDTSLTFDLVRQCHMADTDTIDTLWMDRTSSLQRKSIRHEFARIFMYEWWKRSWIIQEVVVGHNVVMQRGPHHVEWNALQTVVTHTTFREIVLDGLKAPLFAMVVQGLRTEERADEPVLPTLLDLVYNFRFQSATFGSDKIYALLGLPRSDNSSLLIPDYSLSPEEVFLRFTVFCIEQYKDLTILALATGTELQGVSWCRDWRFTDDGSFESVLLAKHPITANSCSASGSRAPAFKADLSRRILSIQGYEVDTIARNGDFYQALGHRGVNWDVALQSWERVVGSLLSEDPASGLAFNRTITADCWLNEPLDWRKRIVATNKTPRSAEDIRYEETIKSACYNRRFFVTKNGRFGLGPWNLKVGDAICILLGGKTPFILRQCNDRARKTSHMKEEEGASGYHKLIGETFVHGMMYYEGDIEDDIDRGSIILNWYHLL
jgi:hypothetical protein